MKKFFAGLWILALLFCSFTALAQARTGYVSDMLILTFREGPGSSFSVLQTLKSDTPLTILEEKNGYYNARLLSGETGWVDMQFISFERPKSLIIEELNQQKKELEAKLESLTKEQDPVKALGLETRLNEALEKNKSLETQLKESQANYTALENQSRDVVQLTEKNKALELANKELSMEMTQMEQKTSHLFRTSMIKWFLAGVGVLLLGWIIGQGASSSKRGNRSLLS